MSEVEIKKEMKKTEISLAVATTLVQMGAASGELTYAAATRVYGTWFTNAVKTGKLQPIRMGSGRGATRWFSVADILAYKAAELEMAHIVLNR